MSTEQSVNDIQKQLDEWNPMRDDYTNSQFNKYISGPGAYLETAVQPVQLSKTSNRQPTNVQSNNNKKVDDNTNKKFVPYLVLKNLPQGTTKNAIYNICSRYGRVSEVRDSRKNDFFFIDFPTVAEMEAVHRALVKNSYGFHVLVGKQKNKQQMEPIPSDSEDNLPPIIDKDSIDLENRNYRASEKNLPRPHFELKPIVNKRNYEEKNSLLKLNDPQGHYLIEDDAHGLEREGMKEGHPKDMEATKYKYRTGRAFIEMPEESRKFIEEKSRQSTGSYDPTRRVYEKNHKDHQSVKPYDIGKCAHCQSLCDIVCARCQTYFCGLECQRMEWPKHRQICGKEKLENKNNDCPSPQKATDLNKSQSLPNNASPSSKTPSINLNEEKSAISQHKEIPRTGTSVTLTSISKTNIVFIRSKASDDNYSFFKLINDVQAAAKNLNKLKKPPNCGQIVIVDFEGQYNRAMVLNSDDVERIKIVYIDYGNLDARKLEDLYDAPDKFIDIQRLAVPVVLKDVPEMYMTEEIRKFMYSYLNGIDLVIKYDSEQDFLAEKGVYKVELIDEASNQNFNKMVSKLCKPTEPTDPDEAYFVDYLPQKQLPKGENIDLIVMDNSLLCTGCISCTIKEWAIEIEKFQNDLQYYARSLKQQCYTPRVGELCIAKYKEDGKWYRGRCLEIVGDGYPSIIFFDYGNIGMVHVNDIRRYPSQFTYPIYTCDCEIKGLPEQCDQQLVQKIEELIPNGSTIHCDSVTIYEEDNFHAITLNKLIKRLEAEGLLKEG